MEVASDHQIGLSGWNPVGDWILQGRGKMYKKQFPGKPPRWKQDNSIYFLTICTYNRNKYLHAKQIPNFIIEELKFYSKKIRNMIAYTVMPDHIHLLIETETVNDMSLFLRDFKKFTSAGIKKLLGVGDKYIWQNGTMDHWIRQSLRNDDFENHLQYIYYNSWKHLGVEPKDFPYHNFIEIVEKGWLEFDFLGSDAPKEYEMYE